MEVKSILRRAQSLRSVSTDYGLVWTEAGLRDNRKSVSQLVAHYQNSPGGKTKAVDSGDVKHELTLQVTPIPISDADGKLENPVQRSRTLPLSRSKSMESLPQRRPAGTTALRELFESKVSTQPRSKITNMPHESAGAEKTPALSNTKHVENMTSQIDAEVKNSHDEQDNMNKEDQVMLKGVSTYPLVSRSERRKTVSGIFTEKRSFPEEDKRRSVADFRDSSALTGREISSISVKALSALYLSKLAAAEPVGHLKPDQDPTSPTGKRLKPVKMAEGAQDSSKHHAVEYAKNVAPELNPSTNHLEPRAEEFDRPFTSPPPTKEAMSSMHQRRQKCELRRLLKHTCPELKNIDGLVEEELADILNTDPDSDTGYQCEVQSKRWLFENHAVSPVDFHQIKRDFQDCDIKRTSCLSEEPMFSSPNEENKPQSQTELEVTSEQNIRVDVKATRRMFEIQSMDTLKDRQSPCPKRNVVSEEHSRSDQKPTNDPETCNFGAKTSDIHSNNHPSDVNFKDTNDIFVGISRAKQVFENRSHDENISTTSDSFSKEEEMLKASVRNRAQMFESTPLDKINQQTKEETETILENMQNTVNSLWKFNIIQADGSILEANENGHVEKARYILIKDSRPEVHDEEIVTGSIKNIMLQMLPGTNLNPTVTFLKEDSQGNVEIHKVDVPTHQLSFTILQDKDYRIANVVQITEDLLGQEKSLRKGVLIQDGVTGTREITVYALFDHNEESIRLVEFDKTECRSILSDQTKILKESEKEDPKIDISCTKAMWDSSSEIDLEANRTINVQLVRSCIEKGDFDHLKHLQKTSSDEDISASTGESEKTSEIIPGNVKNIKALFSTNLDESLQSAESKESKMMSKESGIKNKNNKTEGPMHAKAERCSEMGNNLKIERILPDQDIKDDKAVLQAKLVDVVEDELLNLQTAIMNLHQATIEAKALQQSVQAKHQLTSQPNQTQHISYPGSASHELMNVSCTSRGVRDNSSPIDLEANRTINVQLVRSCIEKGELNHLKHLQKTSSDEDINASTGELEKTSEIIPGNVKNIKALFSTNLDESLQSAESTESKMLSKESVIKNKNNKTEGPMHAKTERCSETGDNLKIERILPDQDIKDEGAVLQAELVDVVEDDELLNLQTAIMNLHQATMEAKALQQSEQAKHQPASQPNQTQQISDPGSASYELKEIKKDSKISENDEPSQITKPEQEEESEDVMRGSIQAALDSLGKSNFNVTKGDFRAAMIYRNSGKGNAGHKKVAGVDQPRDKTGVENKTELSASELQGGHQVFQAPCEGVDTTPCQRPSDNKLLRNQMHVSTDTPSKKHKTPIGPKPAIPPKPDHLKLKPTPNAGVAKSLQSEGQAIATSSKPANEENKEPSPCPKSCPKPISYKDALCKNIQQSVDAHECTSMSVKGNYFTQAKLNPTQVVEESPKSFPESKQSVSESSIEFHTTLQNFGVKPGGSVAPVKPKRIKMAKDHVKNSTENTNNNSAVQQDEIPVQHDRSSSLDDSTSCGTFKAENNDKCDNQQKSEVVKRDKKKKGETEDERRQRLSVHMDEIIKGNMTTVMEIFDKLKKQEELKNILSKVEEIQEDSSEVDKRSLRNIYESMPDWVVPQETKINPKLVLPEHREGASDTPVEPKMLSSMQVAFGDLEKAGAEIISLKEQTLARLIDIEEAIKKALYSVSTLKSDADIVGLSGLFRESMVAVQGPPTSGNISTISIGSSKSPKAQNQNRQLTTPAQNSKPEFFIPTTKQRSPSPASPSFISIQSAARKCDESPSHISASKVEPKEEAKPQSCCSVSSDHRQCTNTKEASSSPANQRQQVSMLEVRTAPEGERVIGMRTISENYEKKDCVGNKFYSSKTQPESRTTSKTLITSSPTTSEIVTYPRIDTPLIRQDRPPL